MKVNKENAHEEVINQLMKMYSRKKNDTLEKDEAKVMFKDMVHYFNKDKEKKIGANELFNIVD